MPKKNQAVLEDVSADGVLDLTDEVEAKQMDMPRDPKPGEPGYDWSQHYDTEDLYTHTFPDGTVVAIKSMAAIYSKTWMYKVNQMRSNSQVEVASLARACCDVANEVLLNFDDSDGDPVEDLIRGWMRAGTGLGDGDEGLSSGN